jgi:hypothetical protein
LRAARDHFGGAPAAIVLNLAMTSTSGWSNARAWDRNAVLARAGWFGLVALAWACYLAPRCALAFGLSVSGVSVSCVEDGGAAGGDQEPG